MQPDESPSNTNALNTGSAAHSNAVVPSQTFESGKMSSLPRLQYIWLAPWTVVKITFLTNRYLNLIAQTVIVLEELNIIGHGAENFCKQFRLASLLLMVFCVESMHIFVIMRAWAIWGSSQQKVAIRLAAGYIIYIGTLIGFGTYYNINSQIFLTRRAVQTEICISYTMREYHPASFAEQVTDPLGPSICETLSVSPSTFSFYSPLSALQGCHYILGRPHFHIDIQRYHIDPKNFLARAFACPLLAVTGQRLVLSLRRLHKQSPDSIDLSREVDRQLKAMECADLWNEGDPTLAPRSLPANSTTEGSRKSSGGAAGEAHLGLKQSRNGAMDKYGEIESVDISVKDRV
ncbi:hypothetical protein PAXINDRAFT_181976 [Paxillus involutus ATCC 200175]|uniref:Uncharacterized protein n=1 Tax=Paxillus involutus ATCC 200175 TaxID=664439 RepID=A0A0C9TSH4_PAXIN|nr:hypothetical protein PAXINDRAFT_181976 [Paxillus involutus ATCC 200175]